MQNRPVLTAVWRRVNRNGLVCLEFEEMRKSSWPEYKCWRGMRQRCLNPRNPRFRNWGGRGIAICEKWSSFEGFFEDMGHRPSPKHSIDRIDNDGPYSKENCRWATSEQQAFNRSNVKKFNVDGEILTISQIAERLGVRRATVARWGKAYFKFSMQEMIDAHRRSA